jgi:hypothetical protein
MFEKFRSLGFEAIIGLFLGFLLSYFIGWWMLPIATAIVSFYFKTPTGTAFVMGSATGTLLWVAYSNFLNHANGGQLSGMLSETFQMPNGAMLATITGLIGGLLGGFGAMTGSLARNVVFPSNENV